MNQAPEKSKLDELRQKAEKLLQQQGRQTSDLSALDILSLIHEVEVHQIELQIQNEELRSARRELEQSRDRYADLYQHAPMGYVDLTRDRLIAQSNIAAKNILGINAQHHLKLPFDLLIYLEDQKKFRTLMNLVAAKGKTSQAGCELRVVIRGDIRFIQLEMASSMDRERKLNGWRIAFVDITERKKLESENIYLQGELKLMVDHTPIVAQSQAMKKVLDLIEQVAGTESTVLITGETGTGKELVARMLHSSSSRKDRPMVTVNCASLPVALIESELFGREKGAYTGALTRMIGRFEVADGATLFLDEIGELPYETQSKLLRVLETGNFERLGSTKLLHTDVRLIAATNRDLEHEVSEGRFRKDLFYRLNVFPILVPPLREHPEDIPDMVWAFIEQFQKRMGKKIEVIGEETIAELQSYSWPGNVRELRHIIERAMIISNADTLLVTVPQSGPRRDHGNNLRDIERRHILTVLEETGWRIGGKRGAAETLGLKRPTLYRKMKELGVARQSC